MCTCGASRALRLSGCSRACAGLLWCEDVDGLLEWTYCEWAACRAARANQSRAGGLCSGRGRDSQHTLTIQDAGLWLCAQAFAHAHARARHGHRRHRDVCRVSFGELCVGRCLLRAFVWRGHPWPAESLQSRARP